MNQTPFQFCTNTNHLSPITDTEAGEVYCADCGMVIVEKIVDRNNDIRTITKEDYTSKTRSGPPSKIAMSDMSKSSIISKKNFDASGSKIQNKVHFTKMRFWDSRSKKDHKEQNLIRAFTMLDSFANKLNMPDNAKEHAAYIYRKAVEKNIIRGSSILAVMTASIYATCKQLGIPRSLDDIANVANINRKRLAGSYRRLVKKLDLDVSTTETNYVSKIGSSVSVNEKTVRLANKIIQDAKKENIQVGKNPIGVTAASIYLSAMKYGENVTLAKISRKNNISSVTIRKIAKLLRPLAAKYIKSIEVTR